MSADHTHIVLWLDPDDLLPEEVAEESEALREELQELGVAVAGVPATGLPAGAKAGEIAVLGALAVTVASSPEALTALLDLVSGWLSRRAARRTRRVRVEIDGDVIELDNATVEEQRQLVGSFVRRHGRR